jgi:signal transduction histidine kinase
MKMPARIKLSQERKFEEEYRTSLSDFATAGGENKLRRAYELGRRALAERKSLVEIAALHHHALAALLRDAGSGDSLEAVLRASGEFLSESLSPYEMAQRGFQDAVKALRQLNETLEEEIKRIAYAVHDEAGQILVAVHLALADLSHDLPAEKQTQIGQIKELLQQVEKHLRRYSHELRPTILDDLGWIPAIRFLAEGVSKRSDVAIHIDSEVSGRMQSTVETVLYRVVQEALSNAVKHAKPRNIWIRAWRMRGGLHCSVRDDGAGFDVPRVQTTQGQKGLGMIAMRERLSAIGGTLTIESGRGQGTELCIRLPLEGEYANSSRSR